MRRILPALLLAALFWIANRGAYKGFFSGDDLDTLAWTRHAGWAGFARGLASPLYDPNNFRPTGHALYHLWFLAAGLRFPPYVATVQALHLLNALLLFWLLRRLKFGEWAAAAGALYWVFHMALFGAFWKPMYVFDVLCGTFALLTLIAWTADLPVPALAAFWLAVKSKEHAIFLPPVLLACEYWLGGRRWKRLAPFFAVSLLFGVQALMAPRPAGHQYRLDFSPSALARTLPFYAPALWLLPLVWMRRERRSWLGIAFLAAMLGTMLFLPGRLDHAYLYVPLLGMAIALAARAETLPRAWTAAALALWLGACFSQMREYRRAELTYAAESREFFEQMRGIAALLKEPEVYAAESPPQGLSWWGVSGIVRLLTGKPAVTVFPTDWPGLREQALEHPAIQLNWRPDLRKLTPLIRDASHADPDYVDFESPVPFWLLGKGWFKQEGNYRWTRTQAELVLRRPAPARRFELRVNLNAAHMEAVKQCVVRIRFDGEPFGVATFTAPGWQTRTWPLAPQPGESRLLVSFEVQPVFRPHNDPRELGIAVGAAGFRDTPPGSETTPARAGSAPPSP